MPRFATRKPLISRSITNRLPPLLPELRKIVKTALSTEPGETAASTVGSESCAVVNGRPAGSIERSSPRRFGPFHVFRRTADGQPPAALPAKPESPSRREAAVAAPRAGWASALRDGATVGGATAATHVLGAATALLLRVALTPTQMGLWQALKLLLSYGNYANLGVSKAAAREWAAARGSGNVPSARRDVHLAFAVNTLSSLGYAVLLAAAGLWVGFQSSGGAAWGIGLVAVGLLGVVARYTTYHVTLLRASQAFRITSRLALLEAGLTLALGPLAAWAFGLPGLYAATLIVLLATVVFLARHRAVDLRFVWDPGRIRDLAAVGGPILLAGTASSLFRSLDKWMILGYLDDAAFELGCYSLALMVGAQLFGLGNMLATVMGPRYAESFGHYGDRRPVAELAAKATELQSAAVALPTAMAIVLGPSVLGCLLPQYGPGLAALPWVAFAVMIMATSLPASQYLVAVGRQKIALGAVLAGTALGAVANHLALTSHTGIRGVAIATSLGYAMYLGLLVAWSLWPELKTHQRCRYLAALTATHGLVVGGTIGLVAWWPGGSAAALAAKTLIAGTIWSIVVGVGFVGGGWGVRLGRAGESASAGQGP